MPQSLSCPNCGVSMSTQPFGSVQVDACSACKGLWFDTGELERLDHRHKGAGPALAAALAVEPAEVPEDRELACPKCAEPLEVELHALATEIELDVCPACEGVFLDAGEFARLRQRKLSPSERTAKRQRRRRRRQRKELARNRQKRAAMVGALMMMSFPA